MTVSTTFAPAELASDSRSSSSESCKSHFETPSFSRPIRSARSCVFCGRVSIICGRKLLREATAVSGEVVAAGADRGGSDVASFGSAGDNDPGYSFLRMRSIIPLGEPGNPSALRILPEQDSCFVVSEKR